MGSDDWSVDAHAEKTTESLTQQCNHVADAPSEPSCEQV